MDADIVLADLGSPSRDALEQVAAASGPMGRPVAMFMDRSDAETTRAAIEAGVSAYVVDGLEKRRIRPIVELAISRFHAYACLRAELAATREALVERKTIDRAKGLLMKARGLSEGESTCGTDKVGAIISCHLATGRIGRPGMGPFPVTGQPNAMDGREVGGLSNMLAAHLEIENPGHRATVRAFWRAPRIAGRPGLKAVDLLRAVGDGRIKALWIIATNPAVSMPEADAVRAGRENAGERGRRDQAGVSGRRTARHHEDVQTKPAHRADLITLRGLRRFRKPT
jgi:CheY-like chemotaxis protein